MGLPSDEPAHVRTIKTPKFDGPEKMSENHDSDDGILKCFDVVVEPMKNNFLGASAVSFNDVASLAVLA